MTIISAILGKTGEGGLVLGWVEKPKDIPAAWNILPTESSFTDMYQHGLRFGWAVEGSVETAWVKFAPSATPTTVSAWTVDPANTAGGTPAPKVEPPAPFDFDAYNGISRDNKFTFK